jgi:hypothetical protein
VTLANLGIFDFDPALVDLLLEDPSLRVPEPGSLSLLLPFAALLLRRRARRGR